MRTPRLAARAAVQGFLGFYRSDDLTYASSIAYYALLALLPFLLLLLSVLGTLTANEADRAAILNFVFRYFPRQLDFISKQLDAFRNSSPVLGIGSILILIWSSLGFFGAITTAVNYAWQVEKQLNYFQHKLVSFLMLLAAGVLMLLALAMLSARSLVGASWFAGVVERVPALAIFESLFVEWATTMAFILVVGLIFYFVPNAKVRFKDVWIGAIVTGVLWRLALLGFGWYVRDLSRFSVHGSIAAVVVFLLWVYVCAVILLYGVEFTVAYARLRRSIVDEDVPPVPAASAPEPQSDADAVRL